MRGCEAMSRVEGNWRVVRGWVVYDMGIPLAWLRGLPYEEQGHAQT